MAMKNLAMSEDEYNKTNPTAIVRSGDDDESSEPKYPYGLTISLDDGSLNKLGIGELPDVGQVMMIKARVVVCSTSQYESQAGGSQRCLGLQITDLDIGKMKKEVSADDVYNKK